MSLRFLVILLALVTVSCASPHVGRTPATSIRESSFSREAYLSELSSRMYRVPEFADIRDWARSQNVRVFAAGGTAAGIAHYVKQDLIREDQKRRGARADYSDSKFYYSYYDIYRSTQDADIVIDGTEADAVKLEAYLKDKFDYLQGSKSVWEVRLLKHSRGEGVAKKEALIGDPNFQNQNTDSHSTGLVEISDPVNGESRVRDLFEWENQAHPRFLEDVLSGKLHYYANPLHRSTARYRAGWNPEILSVIRYYTKAYQYGLEVDPADLPVIQKFIDAFNPVAKAYASEQVQRYIESNGMKILGHAEDIERAWNGIEASGLRRKLIAYAEIKGLRKLSALLSRDPLRTYPIGHGPGVVGKKGTGRTARELGITEVAHETSDFAAYESITMSRQGKPNIYRSRNGVVGESAVYGDGTYVRIGREGARGTGIPIRFFVNPDAVDGTDFYRVPGEDYLVVANGAALRVNDESIDLGVMEYFDFVLSHNTENDRGFMQKLRLRVKSKSSTLSASDRASLEGKLNELLRRRGGFDSGKNAVAEELLSLGIRPDPVTALALFQKYYFKSGRPFSNEVIGQVVKSAGITPVTHPLEYRDAFRNVLDPGLTAHVSEWLTIRREAERFMNEGVKPDEDAVMAFLLRLEHLERTGYNPMFAENTALLRRLVRVSGLTTGVQRAKNFEVLLNSHCYEVLLEFAQPAGRFPTEMQDVIRSYLKEHPLSKYHGLENQVIHTRRPTAELNFLLDPLLLPFQENLYVNAASALQNMITEQGEQNYDVKHFDADVKPFFLVDGLPESEPFQALHRELVQKALKESRSIEASYFGRSYWDGVLDPRVTGRYSVPEFLKVFGVKEVASFLWPSELNEMYLKNSGPHVLEVAKLVLANRSDGYDFSSPYSASLSIHHELKALALPVFVNAAGWEDAVVQALVASRRYWEKHPPGKESLVGHEIHGESFLVRPEVLASPKWKSLYLKITAALERPGTSPLWTGSRLQRALNLSGVQRPLPSLAKEITATIDAKARELGVLPTPDRGGFMDVCRRLVHGAF